MNFINQLVRKCFNQNTKIDENEKVQFKKPFNDTTTLNQSKSTLDNTFQSLQNTPVKYTQIHFKTLLQKSSIIPFQKMQIIVASVNKLVDLHKQQNEQDQSQDQNNIYKYMIKNQDHTELFDQPQIKSVSEQQYEQNSLFVKLCLENQIFMMVGLTFEGNQLMIIETEDIPSSQIILNPNVGFFHPDIPDHLNVDFEKLSNVQNPIYTPQSPYTLDQKLAETLKIFNSNSFSNHDNDNQMNEENEAIKQNSNENVPLEMSEFEQITIHKNKYDHYTVDTQERFQNINNNISSDLTPNTINTCSSESKQQSTNSFRLNTIEEVSFKHEIDSNQYFSPRILRRQGVDVEGPLSDLNTQYASQESATFKTLNLYADQNSENQRSNNYKSEVRDLSPEDLIEFSPDEEVISGMRGLDGILYATNKTESDSKMLINDFEISFNDRCDRVCSNNN